MPLVAGPNLWHRVRKNGEKGNHSLLALLIWAMVAQLAFLLRCPLTRERNPLKGGLQGFHGVSRVSARLTRCT